MRAGDHQCKDGGTPSPGPWKIVRRTTPFADWIMDSTGGVVCMGFGTSDEDLLVNARAARAALVAYRDGMNRVRRRLLELSVGRNAAAMREEGERIAAAIEVLLQTPEREAK